MTIRLDPAASSVTETLIPGCYRREHDVRCGVCGRFMSSVVLAIYFDEARMSGISLDEHLANAGVQVSLGLSVKCRRCREQNAEILFSSETKRPVAAQEEVNG